VLRSDFDYTLPEELIAQSPLPERAASRLLVLDRKSGVIDDRCMRDLPDLLEPGDLLVFNDTRVVAARLFGTKSSGGRVEILLERALGADRALVQMRASKPIQPGNDIATAGGAIRVVERADDLWIIQTPAPALEFFEQWGVTPLPPYIRRVPTPIDRERYQSIFAKRPGAIAAPTASLHFDAALAEALESRGVERTFVTLHVGAGTFQPLRVQDIEAHRMHCERLTVAASTCAAILRARERGSRVIAIGTTVVRALETACANGELRPFSGETDLFIRPGFAFRTVDALVTNFHLPQSTLLMLVCAFGGREQVLNAYHHAVRNRYRFFSYGDAMLLMATQWP
jgi:S-adenosylmethionine:tRNA ribosyltransferase-isomerase